MRRAACRAVWNIESPHVPDPGNEKHGVRFTGQNP